MKVEKKKPARVGAVLHAYSSAALAYPRLFGAIVLATMAIVAGEIVAPLYLKKFVDVLVAGTAVPGVLTTIAWILGAYALVNIVAWTGQRVRMVTIGRLEARTMADLYDKAFGYLLGHSHEFFISNFTGTLTR